MYMAKMLNKEGQVFEMPIKAISIQDAKDQAEGYANYIHGMYISVKAF